LTDALIENRSSGNLLIGIELHGARIGNEAEKFAQRLHSYTSPKIQLVAVLAVPDERMEEEE
jgi:hypothetical protein